MFGTMSSYAQWVTLYCTHKKGNENEKSYTWYKIDRSAMKWYFDSDSESDANMLIKDYKKSGNKETFNLVPVESDGTNMTRSVIIVNDDNGIEQEIQVTVNGYTNGWFMVSRNNPHGKSSSASSSASSSSEASSSVPTNTEDAKSSRKDKAKGKLNDVAGKAGNLLKKKK